MWFAYSLATSSGLRLDSYYWNVLTKISWNISWLLFTQYSNNKFNKIWPARRNQQKSVDSHSQLRFTSRFIPFSDTTYDLKSKLNQQTK